MQQQQQQQQPQQQAPDQQEKIFDTSVFSDYLKSKLTSLFDSIQGKKILIGDFDVTKIIEMFMNKQSLQDNGIHKIQNIDTVENYGLDKEYVNVIFFIYPTIKAIQQIYNILDADKKSRKKGDKNQNEYTLIFWPQRTILCEEAIERLGLTYKLDIKDFNFDLIPLDDDVLSYEFKKSFNDLYVKNDLNIYKFVAESILKIQTVYGKIPNIFAKGDGSRIVLDILDQEVDISKEIDHSQVPEIESLIMFDRNIDLVTPLLNQMLYEAQLDENFNITGNVAWVDASVISSQAKKSEDGKVQLVGTRFSAESSSIYKNIRNQHINQVNVKLTETYQENQETKTQFEKMGKNTDIQVLHQLTQKIKQIQQNTPELEKHFKLVQEIFTKLNTTKCIQFSKEAELQSEIITQSPDYSTKNIIDYVDMQCAMGAPIEQALRLLMLQSQIENGIKPKEYDMIRRSILNAYGFDKVVTLDNLAVCGMIKKNDGSKSVFPKIQSKFKLLYPEVDIENPDDVSYTYEGHAPVMARLAEAVVNKKGWKEYKEYINLIPGQQFAIDRYEETGKVKPCIMVFVIGGVTYSEIAAFRYLGQKYGKEIIVATTQIINHKKIYEQVYLGQNDNVIIERQQQYQTLEDLKEKKKKK